MGPRGNRYWLPFVRLGAVFASVVVGVNLLLHLACPSPTSAASEGAKRDEYFDRKKRKLERHLRSLERFFDRFPGFASPDTGRRAPEEPAPESVEIAWAYAQDVEPLAVEAPIAEAIVLPDAEPRFHWPAAIAPRIRLLDLPRMEDALLEPQVTPELVLDWYRRGAADPAADVGDALLRGPEMLLDTLFAASARAVPRPRIQVVGSDQDSGILSRLVDFSADPRSGRLFTNFLTYWTEREQRYFARFEDSRVASVGFEEGTEDVDMDELEGEQKKILWDALRRTYFSRYKFRAEERIKEDAFYFNEWRGMDFAVLPPLMGGYLWFRGLEKRFSIGGTSLRVSIEPLSEWVREDTLVAGLGLEWAPTKNFPIALIISAGLDEGNPEIDFIGIGTSLGMARKSIALQRQGDERD